MNFKPSAFYIWDTAAEWWWLCSRETYQCLCEVQEDRRRTSARRLFSLSGPSDTRFHRNTSWIHQTAECWRDPEVCREGSDTVTQVLPPHATTGLTSRRITASPLVHVVLLSFSFPRVCVTLVSIAIVVRGGFAPGVGVLAVSAYKQE